MTIFDSLKAGEIKAALAEIGKSISIAHERDSVGRTPLMYVALFVKKPEDCDALVAALTKAGAEPNAQDFRNGRTALHWACEANNLAYYTALKEHAPNDVWYLFRDNHEKTPFMIAREKQFVQLFEALELDRWSTVALDKPMRLAVIGVGAAGAAMFIRLVKRMMMTGQRFGDKFFKEQSIYLIDDKAELGTGTAYSKELNSTPRS